MATLKEVYDGFLMQLINSLPMKDSKFIHQLDEAGLLTGIHGVNIKAKSTSKDAAIHFLHYVINGGWSLDYNLNPRLDKLLEIMKNYDNISIKSLAGEIATGNVAMIVLWLKSLVVVKCNCQVKLED